MEGQQHGEQLKRGLKNRHIQLIALGGAIGTGLFLGSASVIQSAGPGIILGYAIAGFIAFLIMRQLGEMVVEEPVAGSFSHFAYKYWGSFAGFASGWNYWVLYVLVAMAELTAVGKYIQFWYPEIPTWVSAAVFFVVINAINLTNVKVFGEMEFWLSLVKVVAIIAMMLAGAGIIFFGFGHSFPATGLENLWSHGGFAPNGWQGVIASLGIVMFAFGGVEIIGVTAAEAKDPKKVIPQAINTIPLRIILFYVCTLAVLMAIFPWNSFGEQGSPFVLIFDGLGIPAAATILNIIVISASISAINSDIFGAGRMMYGMSKEGLAPKSFQRIASNGVPWMTVVVMGGALLAAVVLNYLIPEQVFVLIASLAAFATVWVWLMILLSHFAMRRGLSAEERSQIAFPIPFWPVAPLLTLLFMGLVIAVLGMFAETRMALIAGLVWLGLLTVVWYARVRKTALQVVTEQ